MSRLQITALNVTRRARHIVHDINLTIESGSVTAILGPNGAGKSTVLNSMAGLLRPTTGAIHLDGRNLFSLSAAERARQIAFLPQLSEIAWALDVQALVSLARIPYRGVLSDIENHAAVVRAMERTNIKDWAERIVTTLSGGERARVLLARVFAGEPEWILADEPFTGLDPAHQFEAAELLREVASAGTGVVLTVHDLTLAARIASRIIILHQGRVVADGVPKDALQPSILRQVYGIDAEWLIAHGRDHAPVIAIHGRHVV